MSKKIKEAIDTTNTIEMLTTGDELRELLEKYTNVSLRKVALACEMSYGWILKRSKEPVAGEAYDPTAINYGAVAEVFNKRNVDLHDLDWEALNTKTEVSRGSLLTKDMDAFKVGQKVYLREDNVHPFEICYKTGTHIVIMKEGTTEPRAWSHATFLMKGPVFEPRTKGSDTATEEEA